MWRNGGRCVPGPSAAFTPRLKGDRRTVGDVSGTAPIMLHREASSQAMNQRMPWPEVGGSRLHNSADQHSDGQRIGILLRRGGSVILASVALSLAVATIHIVNSPSIYVASTQVLYDPHQQGAAQSERDYVQYTIDTAQLESQIQVLKSEEISRTVISAHALRSDSEFSHPAPSLLGRLRSLVVGDSVQPDDPAIADARTDAVTAAIFDQSYDVRRVGQSYVLLVTFRSLYPEKAARLANAVTAAYVARQLTAKVFNAERAGFLQAPLQDLNKELESAREAIKTGVLQPGAFPSANVQILNTGRVPLARAAPQVPLILAFSTALGLLLGTAAVIAWQRLNRCLVTPGQAQQALGLACLGELPTWSRWTSRRLKLWADDPSIPYIRKTKNVRAALEIALPIENRTQCIGILSARRREGRSLLAAHLARAFAANGETTLLIDGDLSSAALTLAFAPATEAGEAFSTGTSSARERGLRDVSGFNFLSAATQRLRAPNSSLGNSLRSIVEAERSQHHRIIVDLPPLSDFPDSWDALNVFDSIVVVILSGSTPQADVEQVLDSCRLVHTSIAGVVMNSK